MKIIKNIKTSNAVQSYRFKRLYLKILLSLSISHLTFQYRFLSILKTTIIYIFQTPTSTLLWPYDPYQVQLHNRFVKCYIHRSKGCFSITEFSQFLNFVFDSFLPWFNFHIQQLPTCCYREVYRIFHFLIFALVPVFIYFKCKPVLECSSIFYQLSRHYNVSNLLSTVIAKSKYIFLRNWIYYFHFYFKLITIFKTISKFYYLILSIFYYACPVSYAGSFFRNPSKLESSFLQNSRDKNG